MRDDAVAPVIAVMLILAAVATLFAVFNGIYIPSLKQAAETEHLRNVESSFQHFSSDIERAVANRKGGMTVSEPVQMGGGDIFLNTLKSGGSLSVVNEDTPVYYLILDTDGGLIMRNGTIVNISYDPVGNFWQDQGYCWQYGFLNVTKYGTRQSPISYSTMGDVYNDFNDTGSLAVFAGSFGSVEGSRNLTQLPVYDEQGNITSFAPRDGNCSTITITAVNISASPDHPFTSGNGFGRLELRTTITTEHYHGVNTITLVSDGRPFGNATVKAWNESLTTLAGGCGNNVGYNPDPGWSGNGFSTFSIRQQVSPVDLSLNTVNIVIGTD
ncbi:hypothetical protein [Methanoregula sp.]|uniref:hypothetical protein n=1 Tax=Methanoregula sp. TaxID=2052170 RepID=UPI00262B95D5|nr:hypothetical protein [Methanoregula sp.]MDD5144353.1 hypothetical protein [Methanoregula sp.]